MGNKQAFVKEIEEALICGEIDIAVHSLKDLSTTLPENLTIGAYIKPTDPRDALISSRGCLKNLPEDACIGTGSLRRALQLKILRPDLDVKPIRGNVDTRIKRVDGGEYDAVILAVEGLKRLGLEKRITEIFPVDKIVPAPCQGVIAIQMRRKDREILQQVRKASDLDQMLKSEIERGILKELGATCTTPIGLYSEIKEGSIGIDIFFSTGLDKKYIQERLRLDFTNQDKIVGVIAGEIRGAWKALTGEEMIIN